MISILSQACSRHQIVQSPHMTRDRHHFRSQTKQNKTLENPRFVFLLHTLKKTGLLIPKPSENLPAEMALLLLPLSESEKSHTLPHKPKRSKTKQNKTPRLSFYTPELLKILQTKFSPLRRLILLSNLEETSFEHKLRLRDFCTTPTTTNPRSPKNRFLKLGELLSSQPKKRYSFPL